MLFFFSCDCNAESSEEIGKNSEYNEVCLKKNATHCLHQKSIEQTGCQQDWEYFFFRECGCEIASTTKIKAKDIYFFSCYSLCQQHPTTRQTQHVLLCITTKRDKTRRDAAKGQPPKHICLSRKPFYHCSRSPVVVRHHLWCVFSYDNNKIIHKIAILISAKRFKHTYLVSDAL